MSTHPGSREISILGALTLLEADGGPLVSAGERDGQQIAIITLDLHDFDLPLQIAFPALVANIEEWRSSRTSFERSIDNRGRRKRNYLLT